MINFRPVLLATLAALALSAQVAQAQAPAPYGYGYGNSPYQAPYPYRNQNYYGGNRFFNNGPFNSGPFTNAPFNNRSFSNGPFSSGPFRNGPFGGNNRGFGEQFWPGRGSVYDDILPANGPWNRSWGRAPWNRNYDNMWGRKGGPRNWVNFSDPKEGVAQAWEDMLVTPNELGTMPGGWKAPSISVPNPIDVGDEFKNVARDMPSEMQNFSEGFTYGEDEGYNNYPNQGNRNNDGISFNPGNRR